MYTIEDRIKNMRTQLNLSQAEFGKKVGVTQQAVAMWEAGKRTPPESAILSIVREFNVNEVWLRTGEGEMFRPMTRTNEISAFIGKALKADDDIKQRVIWALSQLYESEWATINKIIDLIADKKEKGPD